MAEQASTDANFGNGGVSVHFCNEVGPCSGDGEVSAGWSRRPSPWCRPPESWRSARLHDSNPSGCRERGDERSRRSRHDLQRVHRVGRGGEAWSAGRAAASTDSCASTAGSWDRCLTCRERSGHKSAPGGHRGLLQNAMSEVAPYYYLVGEYPVRAISLNSCNQGRRVDAATTGLKAGSIEQSAPYSSESSLLRRAATTPRAPIVLSVRAPGAGGDDFGLHPRGEWRPMV